MASTKVSIKDQEVINELNRAWVWVPKWQDFSDRNTAGRIVHFVRNISLEHHPTSAIIHCSADTRYKLFINGVRVAVGPSRGSPAIWYYDTLDITRYLQEGPNHICFSVIRYFAQNRAAMPFERSLYPGLTVCGSVLDGDHKVRLSTVSEGWTAEIDNTTEFPTGIIDDGFLHISERVDNDTGNDAAAVPAVTPTSYNFNTRNGDLLPWRLRPRLTPMPQDSQAIVNTVRAFKSDGYSHHTMPAESEWPDAFAGLTSVKLPMGSTYILELQADVHQTAFTRWRFRSNDNSHVTLKVIYSEGYEDEPRSYPFFRSKGDRLDAKNGHIIGPYDEVKLCLEKGQVTSYEPFWFRTFRVMKIEIGVGGPGEVEFMGMEATQTNYPLAVKASWKDASDAYDQRIWDVSIRTLRNCMHDAYSDCPFYEQLQYSMDSRSVGLFHYLLSGDDRLIRQTLINFASSSTFEGLTQSRYPSHVPQIIAGFSLYWILQVCDHHLYFGDHKFTRSFLARIDGVLEFFDAHIDEQGLISGLPDDVWQFVDWVTTWGATDEHPDKGVPISGRKNNLHTYFSMLYAYVLRQAAAVLRQTDRPRFEVASEYEARAEALVKAVRKHCYDGAFFTDSTTDIADDGAYSEQCQVWAVLSGAAEPDDSARLLTDCLSSDRFSKCSYMMRFYTFRALRAAGDDCYESHWQSMIQPWRNMIDRNLSTWEEDDVRQRSDCHAWGSVPIYEFCTELAGLLPTSPGCAEIMWRPRVRLSKAIDAKVALGKDNVARVQWREDADGSKNVRLTLEKDVRVCSQIPGKSVEDHGVTNSVTLVV